MKKLVLSNNELEKINRYVRLLGSLLDACEEDSHKGTTTEKQFEKVESKIFRHLDRYQLKQ